MENLHNDAKLQGVKLPFAINSSILSFNLYLLTEKKITVKFLFDMCAVGQNLFEVGIII